MTVPLLRKRARRPKVKTGCRTCRARHIKCGEEKPTCLNCEVARRECAGYDIVIPPARSRLPLLQPNEASTALTYRLPTLPEGVSSRDGYALDYFVNVAFGDLPGNSWSMSWERLILPYCRSEPAILNAAMAIGSLQRVMASNGISDIVPSDHLTTALSQYGRSASMVRNSIEKLGENHSEADVETVLTASLLLFCFEVLHGQDEHAAMHLRHGLNILYERSRNRTQKALPYSHPRPIELQVPARTRMDLLTQTFVRLDSDLSELSDFGTFLSPICGNPIPKSFSSLDEALVHVDVLHSRIRVIGCQLDEIAEQHLKKTYPGYDTLDEDMQAVLNVAKSRSASLEFPAELEAQMEKSRQALCQLMAALATMPASPSDPHRMLVEINVFFVWFDASSWRVASELEMDRFNDQFEHILGVCEQYFASDRASVSQPTYLNMTRPSFVMGTSVGQTVCLIVEKCRNSLIRQRGLQLLSEMDMRGVFDGAFLASFYQNLVDGEERLARQMLGLPEGHVFRFREVPEEARFIEIDAAGVNECDDFYWKDEIGRMVFVRLVDGELKAGDYLFPVQRPIVLGPSPLST